MHCWCQCTIVQPVLSIETSCTKCSNGYIWSHGMETQAVRGVLAGQSLTDRITVQSHEVIASQLNSH